MHYTFDDIPSISEKLIATKNTKKVIAIAWPSASWKTLFARKLAEYLREKKYTVLEISSDNYYQNNTQLLAMIYGTYDHPNLIEYDHLNHDLHDYLETGKANLPIYSFIEKRTISYTPVEAAHDFVIVEGIYTISHLDPKIPHTSIFVTSPSEELLIRRFLRDQERLKEPDHLLLSNMDNMFPMRNVYGKQQEKAEFVVYNTFNILDKVGTPYEVSHTTISDKRTSQETLYSIDHVYHDTRHGQNSDLLIVSENYEANDRKILKSVDVKNVLKYISEWKHMIKLLTFRFYQPGIITTIHSLFQLAWMNVLHSSYMLKTRYKDVYNNEYIHLLYEKTKHSELLIPLITKDAISSTAPQTQSAKQTQRSSV